MISFRILDIEYEMTQFAFYYVGIGAAVFLLGYFQVSLSIQRNSSVMNHLCIHLKPIQSAWHNLI